MYSFNNNVRALIFFSFPVVCNNIQFQNPGEQYRGHGPGREHAGGLRACRVEGYQGWHVSTAVLLL